MGYGTTEGKGWWPSVGKATGRTEPLVGLMAGLPPTWPCCCQGTDTLCASSRQGKARPQWVLFITPNCCSHKVGITWVLPQHSCELQQHGISAQAGHSPRCPPFPSQPV